MRTPATLKNSLYIDERGIIWIGTREGLNRYNGNDIKSFKLNKNDPNSLFINIKAIDRKLGESVVRGQVAKSDVLTLCADSSYA